MIFLVWCQLLIQRLEQYFRTARSQFSSSPISPHLTVQLRRFLIEQIPQHCPLPGNFLLKTSVKNPDLQHATENNFCHYWEIVKSDFKILSSYVQSLTLLPGCLLERIILHIYSYLHFSAAYFLHSSAFFPRVPMHCELLAWKTSKLQGCYGL